MTVARPDYRLFRERLSRREPILGTFLKIPSTQPVEILGSIGYDFVILDQEHAPLGPAEIDIMVLAARASNVAPLVRVGESGDGAVLSALDCGALGIMFPHVSSVEKAKAVVRTCRYASGKRGFAGMTRAAKWGAVRGPDHMKQQDAQVACVAMIEDREAVDCIDDIVRVEGIDAIFIGRGDLTASYGSDPDAGKTVADLTARIAKAASAAGMPLMMLATSKADALSARDMGASAIMVASDHNFLKSAAAQAFDDYRVS